MKLRTIKNVIIASLIYIMAFPTLHVSANTTYSIVDYNYYSYVDSNGYYWTWGSNNRVVPTHIVGLEPVKQAFEGGWIVKEDGTVWVWNENKTSPIEMLEVKGADELILTSYEFALDKSGQVFIKSAEPDKPFAAPTLVTNITDVVDIQKVYYSTSIYLIVKSDGSLWTLDIDSNQVLQVPGISNVKQILYNYALDTSGTLWEIFDAYDAFDLKTEQLTPQKLATSASFKTFLPSYWNGYLAIDSNDYLWFWGNTKTGDTDQTELHKVNPIQFSSLGKVKDAAHFERTLAVVTQDGKLYTTSTNVNNLTANAKFKLMAEQVTSVEGGLRHMMFQTSDGKLWGIGVNKGAELGNGTFEFSYDEPIPLHKGVSVSLNGELIQLSNGALIRENQVYLPIRSVFTQLGATIHWDETQKLVTITSSKDEELEVKIYMKEGTIYLNGKLVDQKTIGAVGSTSYLPLRFVSEILGAKVEWISNKYHVAITYDNN